MVHRATASAGKKGSGKAKASRKSRVGLDDDLASKRRQWSTVPPELDEDIDDDLAFDSEDEAKYGAFFSSKKPAKSKKEAEKEIKGTFDRLNAVGAAEEEALGFSDDSRDEIDLSEMLESKEDMRAARAKRRSKAQQKAGRKSTVKEPLTTEAETLLGPSDAAASSIGQQPKAGVKKLLKAAATGAAARLENSLSNNRMLLTRDVDDITKERKDRAKVREVVGEQLTKYKPILKQQSTVRHLSFPLRPVEAVCPVPKTLTGLVSAVQELRDGTADDVRAPDDRAPSSHAMASKMNALLQASGLQAGAEKNAQVAASSTTEDMIKFESDEQQGATRPSIGYMQKLKSMLAYENARRRRFNKIKSKTYRRILRKEKEREDERRNKAFELLHPEEARRRLQKKMDDMRAEERVTQKHKNTSKWVRHAKKFAKIDGNTKDAIDEQHQIHQRLMAKMEEEAADELNGKAAETDESDEEERVVDALLAGDKNVKSALWADETETKPDLADLTPVDRARLELKQMGFMKKAKQRHDEAMEEDLRDLQEDVKKYVTEGDTERARAAASASAKKRRQRGENGGDDDDALDEIDDDSAGEIDEVTRKDSKKQKAAKKSSETQGRRRFGELDDTRKAQARPVDLGKRSGPSAVAGPNNNAAEVQQESGDELPEIVDDDDEKPVAAPKRKKTRVEEKTKEINAGFAGDRVTAVQKSTSASTRVVILPKPKAASVAQPKVDVDSVEPAAAMNQDYLVARAFANDEVDEEFLALKERQVEDIMRPVDKNASLPGWGEWGGESERLNANHRSKVEKMELERRIEKSSLMKARADAELENVIINHEVDLVPGKYQLHMVPRPFSNAKEFARSMRQPMGPEWNTALGFKEGNQPRITTIQGVAIDPLSLDTHAKKSKTARRKMSKKSAIGEKGQTR